jgi:flagellar protein FlgJ
MAVGALPPGALPPGVQSPPRPAAATSSRLPPSTISGPPDLGKIAKSAQDFEAMAIGQLLQPMFDTVDTAHSAFGGQQGEEAWKPMLVQEIAKHIAAHGGLGLAKPVYDAMLRIQETNSK